MRLLLFFMCSYELKQAKSNQLLSWIHTWFEWEKTNRQPPFWTTTATATTTTTQPDNAQNKNVDLVIFRCDFDGKTQNISHSLFSHRQFHAISILYFILFVQFFFLDIIETEYNRHSYQSQSILRLNLKHKIFIYLTYVHI